MGLHLIADVPWYLNLDTWFAILMVVLGLSFVIFVHELGHFLVAKWCGVKCEKFYVGFDAFEVKIAGWTIIPSSLVKFRLGETVYGLGIIPLGGYVKMLGQDDNPRNAEREAERARIAKARPEAEQRPAPSQAPTSQAPASQAPASQAPASQADGADGGDAYELDPRSYRAKSVPQRMAIISAGVIMNLIFAVIFAMIAYRIGVSYTPTEIGVTIPGGPAWMANLEPGDRIVQLGRRGQPSEHLRYDWDLRQSVGMGSARNPVDMLVRQRDGELRWVTVQPEPHPEHGLGTIGVLAAAEPWLDALVAHPELAAAAATPALRAGDRIVAVDGQPVATAPEIQLAAARRPWAEVTLSVERQVEGAETPERLEVQVPAQAARDAGLVPEMGPIRSVQPGSPADRAGLRVGDRMIGLDGQPIEDPLRLPQQLLARVGEVVELEVERPGEDGELQTLVVSVEPQLPQAPPTAGLPPRDGASDELGVAYLVSETIRAVRPDSPASEAGLRAGDQLLQAHFVVPEEALAEAPHLRRATRDPLDLTTPHYGWPAVDALLQVLPSETRVALQVQRDGTIQNVTLATAPSADRYVADRGLVLAAKQETRVVDSWNEAVMLGVRQTKEDAQKVLLMLRRLVTGAVSVTNLGGPGSIAVVATSEASQGPARLLIFLTFLSANLAVLNFLPIPVLDGGHFLFLTAEAIRRKPLDEKLELRLTLLGLAFILSLMLFVIGMDVVRISQLVAG